MKTPSLLPVSLFSLLTAALFLSPLARAQSDTGGTGTIDPSTIATREVVRDSSLIEDSRETLDARYLASDSAGNLYVGTTATLRGSVANSTRCAISKYAPNGVLLWRHEGETANDFKDPSAPGETTDPYVALAGLSVDAAGNVVVGFTRFTYSYNYQPIPDTRTLLVGYSPGGQLRWRDLTGKDPTTTPNPTSKVQSVLATPDGGALALLTNSSGDPYNTVIVVRLAADGTERFNAVFGTNADDLDVLPIDLADDGSGNAYLLTREVRRETGNPGLIGVGFNVARRLGPTGAVTAQLTASAADSATDAWVQARTDSGGNLYIAANYRRNRTNATSGDGRAGQLVLAYNLDLSLRWRALGPQPAQAAEEQPTVQVRGLRLSPGGITVAGTILSDALNPSSSDRHWEVTRFAYADGAVQWHRLYQSPTAPTTGSRGDTITNFQVDAADNVYAAGYRSTASQGNELTLIKYSGVGDTQFIKPLPAADQKFSPNDQAFQLTGDGHPAFLSASYDGQQAVVLTFDNPAVVPAQPAASQHAPFFSGEVSLGNGIYYLALPNGQVFGYYAYLSDPRFLFHLDMGYLYWFDGADAAGSIYFYDFTSDSFFYTSRTFSFPYLYDFKLNAFLYYYPDANNPGRYTTNPRYFFNFNTGQIIMK